MKNILVELRLIGPWQGDRRLLKISLTDGPESSLTLGEHEETTSIQVPYGVLCRLRLLDMEGDPGTIRQEFRKTFVAGDTLPRKEIGERIVVVGLRGA